MDRLAGSRFAALPVWVLDAEISDRAVRLYAVLQTYLTGRDGAAWPSRQALADRLRCSVDTLDRTIRELVDAGAVEVSHRYAPGKQMHTSNTYRIVADHPAGSRTDAATVAAPTRPRSRTDAALKERPNEVDPKTPQPPAETAPPAVDDEQRGAPPPAPPAYASPRKTGTNPRATGTNPRGPQPNRPATVTAAPVALQAYRPLVELHPPPDHVDPDLVRRARDALTRKAAAS